jgi:tetratricopeptide (TPR) repeat protein
MSRTETGGRPARRGAARAPTRILARVLSLGVLTLPLSIGSLALPLSIGALALPLSIGSLALPLSIGSLALAVGGCRSAGGDSALSFPATPLPQDALEALRAVRADIGTGDLPSALARLDRLAESRPADIDVAVLRQEVELQLRAREHADGGETPEAAAAAAEAELREYYASAAEEEPTPVSLVLAARLEPDPERALSALERALRMQPDHAWAHYGSAHAYSRLARHREARESLDRALALAPWHLRARRLDATLRARAGETEQARAALLGWLGHAVDSPFVPAAERAEALIDLAILEVLSDDASEAERRLRQAESLGPRDASRLELVRAAAEELRERPERALQAAARAGELDPDDPLPEVQRALLFEFSQDDLAGARDAWLAVLARLDRTGEAPPHAGRAHDVSSPMRSFLLRLQAGARLARIEAEIARRAAAEPSLGPGT